MIRRLCDGTSKRIKAQQYIQNTYVVVKELVENSIDSGSTVIRIRIDDGIVVEDNGSGIEEMDKVGVEGHTSKEHTSYYVLGCGDANGDRSHGFRGQALSSVADLCDLEITSRTGNRQSALRKDFSNGTITECAREVGTTVRITNLFKNCPVRRSINNSNLKKDIGRICTLIESYRCVNRIQFTLFYGKRVFLNCCGYRTPQEYFDGQYPGLADRCLVVDGRTVELVMLPVPIKDPRQMMFFNRRPISNRRILSTVKTSFNLYVDGAPTFVLTIKGRGDVNVSVDKSEVILPDEEIILNTIRSEISRFFSSEIHLDAQGSVGHGEQKVYRSKDVGLEGPTDARVCLESSPMPPTQRNMDTEASREEPRLRNGVEVLLHRTPRSHGEDPSPDAHGMEENVTEVGPQEDPSTEEEDNTQGHNVGCTDIQDMHDQGPTTSAYSFFEHDELVQAKLSFLKEDFTRLDIIGQFNNGFIITRLERGGKVYLVAVDQHAADEITNFETIKRTLVLKKQRVITPIKLELTPVDEMVVSDNLETFNRNGFVVRDGMLETVPVYRNEVFGVREFHELLEDVKTEEYGFRRLRDIIASKACRSSVMVGEVLSMNSMKRIVSGLAALDVPWRCPHGRPTFMVLNEPVDT